MTDIIPNAFLENLGTDWLAIDTNGHIVGRATTEAAVRQAVPDADRYVNDAILNPPPPPVDNKHVAPGAKPFTADEVDANKTTAKSTGTPTKPSSK